ncbi:META domain-containing protein [Acinetobacter chinensis]|uniref:META domain-containing protein n=2 Tax=Acinetobacter chinensis TaxID=2004650 RepID=A0A3B7LWX7_9GAMM|nr:META domain-containing protein [Acinetobacter chinensis]
MDQLMIKNQKKFTHILFITLLSITFSGCQTLKEHHQPSQKNHSRSEQSSELQVSDWENLQHYTWSYQPVHSKHPIQIRFSHNHIHAYGGCNRMGRTYIIENQTTIIPKGSMISTLIGCSALENERLIQLFLSNPMLFKISDRPERTLKLTLNNGESYTFSSEQEQK